MASFNTGPVQSFPTTAGTTAAKYLRVTVTAGVLAIADAANRGIGVLEEALVSGGLQDGKSFPVRLFGCEGTMPMVASGAITAQAPVYAAAGGKISATVGPVLLGRAMEAASGNNSIIAVQVLNSAL